MDKRNKIMTVSILFFFSVYSFLYAGGGLSITLTPKAPHAGWEATIDGTVLSGTAGTDTNDIESLTNQAQVDLKKTSGTWQVEFSFSDTSQWDNNLILQIRRTSDGGNTTITGGTNYVTLGTSSQVLFTGTGDVSNVDLQYRIPSGIISQGIRANTSAWIVTVMATVTDGF